MVKRYILNKNHLRIWFLPLIVSVVLLSISAFIIPTNRVGAVGSTIFAGTSGQALRVEAMQIKLDNAPEGVGVRYRGHVQNIGWQDWVSDGGTAGTSGKGLRVEAIQIELVNAPEGMSVQYRGHVQNVGWQNWVSDGATAGTSGRSLRVEAIQIRLVNPSTGMTVKYRGHVQNIGWQSWVTDGMNLQYRCHVQNIGWMAWRTNEETCGTSGQALRVEAMQIKLDNAPEGVGVRYRGHVQNIGWQDWVSDGGTAGTSGKGLRVEAIQIELVNAPEGMSVQYRGHVQNVGWQDWVSDGATAGTSGRSLRVEAIQIRLAMNVPITAISSISGTPQVGETLTAGALTPSGATATYQWQKADTSGGTYSNINGATSSTYTLVSGDVGKYIKVMATGNGDYSGSVTSSATESILGIPITAISPISGTTQVGEILTAGTLTPSGATASYQWQIADSVDGTYINITNATSNLYSPVTDDVGKYIKVIVTGNGSYSGIVMSVATSVIEAPSTIKIGEQIWMKKNVNVGNMINVSSLQSDNGAVEKYCYDNDINNCIAYGGLYSWNEMMQYSKDEEAKGICLSGFHVPSDTDWKTLEMYLGMTQEQADAVGFRGTDQGTKLKVGGTSGFNAIFAGNSTRTGDSPRFGNLGYSGIFWSSSLENDSMAYNRLLQDPLDIYRSYYDIRLVEFSVRCIKDKISINSISSISGTPQVGETLTAGVLTPSGATASYQWQSADTEGGTYTNISGASSSTYALIFSDLGKYIKVVVTGIGDYTGTQTSTVSAVVSDANWKAIGTQVWAKANLNVGTMVTGVTAQTNNSVVEKYCYNDTESNCTTYGALYQWDEAMQYITTVGAQGICPAGSHIPSDNDWKILEMQLGMTQATADTTGWRGTDQGTQLKSGGTSGLNMPLAGGRYSLGSFHNLSVYASLWSSSESSTSAWNRYLNTGTATVNRDTYAEGVGFSVRCLKGIPVTSISPISGNTQVGQTLTAGTIAPSGATMTYQWQSAIGSNGIYYDIDGATSSTYTLASGDFGKSIKVVATGIDNYSGIVISTATSESVYVLIDSGSLGTYPWNSSNCSMSDYISTGGVDGNGNDGYGYGCRQAASYVAWKIAQETGQYYSWGNPVNFTANAIAAGYVEGSPQAGSIAVMDSGSYGHVAWVEAVGDNMVTISQYNYNYGAGYGMYSMMELSAGAFDHYIKIK